MGLNSKVSIVFPYEMSALLNAMGMIWDFTKGHYSIPIEMAQALQGHCGNGMGLLHTIPLVDTMGNIWNFTKYVAVPYECSVIMWYHYGTDPYHSHTRSYGECMELYKIRRNPIVKDNRNHLVKIQLLLWVQYGSYHPI